MSGVHPNPYPVTSRGGEWLPSSDRSPAATGVASPPA
jgi:hypothetical protein